MKNRKRYTMLLAAALVFNFMLSGCGEKNAANTNPTDTTSGSQYITKDPLDLSIHLHVWNNMVYSDDSKVFMKAKEMTNINLIGVAAKAASDSKQAFNILMASGDLPDIITYTKSDIEEFSIEGAFVQLDELIDKYAPNIKEFMEKNAKAKKYMKAADGKIYLIPNFMDGEVAKGWMIRKDWLDKLGLSVPKTVDEYYKVLKAFREQDANGNGKKDEVAFFTRDNIVSSSELLPLFGVRSGWDVKNGKVQYGPYTPEYKNAMSSIAKWYSEDLIDKEIFTRGNNARDSLFGNNLGGSTHDWFTSTASYNSKLKEKIPEFQLIPIAPPADINGKVWEESTRGLSSGIGWAITSNNKHPVETIKYFDFWFSTEGRRLMNFGLEGQQYDMAEGKPKFRPELLNGKRPALTILNELGAQMPVGFWQDFSYEEQLMDPIAKEGVKMYMDNNYCEAAFPNLTFTPEERAKLDEKWPAITTFVSETKSKWVLGGEPVEGNFDQYMSKLRSMGMDEILVIYQNAYDRYQKQ